MRLKLIPLITLLLATPGCEWLKRADTQRSFDTAREDDRACRAEGYRWPGDAYVACRRFRADERQRELWQEMQLTNRDDGSDLALSSPRDAYRPIRAENFTCRKRTADGETWIACSETGN